MMALPPSLRRFHGRSLRKAILRRALLWALLSTGGLALWTAVCVLLRLPRSWQDAAIMGAASLLPAVSFWPFSRQAFLLPLRELDLESVAESFLEAEGPPRAILAERLAALEPLLARGGRSFRNATRGLSRPGLFALSSLGILQLVAILTFSRPLLIWEGGETLDGSGMRLAESTGQARRQATRPAAPLSAPRRSAREAGSPATATDTERARAASFQDARFRLGQDDRMGIRGAGAQDRTNSDQAQARATAPETAKTLPPQTPGNGLDPTTDSAGASAPNPGKGEPEGVTGYEGRGPSGLPSPLIDYRTRLYKELAAREGRELRASGDLVTTPLPELQRRWFSSFEMSADIGPREDAWTSLLRRKWAEISAGLEAGK